MLPKAILFDLDETLLDNGDHAATWASACRMGIERTLGAADQVAADDLIREVAVYRDWYWSDPERHKIGRMNLHAAYVRIVASALRKFGVVNDVLADAIAVDGLRVRKEGRRLFPDAIDVLTQLNNHGVRLALVTNGTREEQREKIEYFALSSYFEHILIEGEFGEGKPSPRVYTHVLDTLQVATADSWMVGDKLEWEVRAPQSLGMRGIWFNPRGIELPLSNPVRPDRIIGSLSELLPPKAGQVVLQP